MVVRIMLMVPIYAVSSFISLVSLEAAVVIDAVRDIYEASVPSSTASSFAHTQLGIRHILLLCVTSIISRWRAIVTHPTARPPTQGAHISCQRLPARN